MSTNEELNKQQKARLLTLAEDCDNAADQLFYVTAWLASSTTRTPREDRIYLKLAEALAAVREALNICEEGLS